MSVAQFFKAYDLRGTTPHLTSDVYYWSGFALIQTILKPQNLPLCVVLVRDCRLSSPEFYNAFAKGIEDAGGLIISLGIGTTDLMYAASMSLDLPGAIITASHNPANDNGLKIVKEIPQMLGLKDGLDKIRDFVVHKIEVEKIKIDLANLPDYPENAQIKNQVIEFFVNKIKEIGKVEELIKLTNSANLQIKNGDINLNNSKNSSTEIIENKSQNKNQNEKNNLANSNLENLETNLATNLKNISKNNSDKNYQNTIQFLPKKSFKKLKVVVDTANGMGGFVMPYLQKIYAELVDFVPLFWELDGSFPNHAADPINPENLRFLSQRVVDENADFGIAMDGDADRAFFVDENGTLISGEHLVALFAQEILSDNFENGEPKIKLKLDSKSEQNLGNIEKTSQILSKLSNEILDKKATLGQKLEIKIQELQKQSKTQINQFNPAIVYVISYSRALPDTVLENNGIPIISKQGHTFVKSQMSKYKAIYGGEASGHHYFGQFGFMDSGVITIATFIKILIQKNFKSQNLNQNLSSELNKKLDRNLQNNFLKIQSKTIKASDLCAKWSDKYFVSGEQNFVLPKNLTMPRVVQIIKQNYQNFTQNTSQNYTISELDGITVYDILSKFTIRGSNTEPLLRINIETKMENKTGEILDKIREILRLN